MSVMRNAGMIVFQSFRMGRIFMMLCRMDQDIKACPFSGRNRNNRDSQHFRKTVQVDLHSPLFHDIHHIQRHDHRFSKFQQLQRQVKIPFQCRCVHHINDHIHLITQNKLPGYLLFHCIGSQTVGSRKIHQFEFMAMVLHGSFYFFHRHARPVGHL